MKTETQHINPFPGLRAFRSDEDYLYFGREEQTMELLDRLRTHRFLAVVGTSGSGKSSLVRCGLLSELQGGNMLQAGTLWEIAVTHPGGHPMSLLADALLDAGLYDGEQAEAKERLLATLGRSHFGLVEAVRQAHLPEGTNFLLVVDQFEELFRFNAAGRMQSEVAHEFVSMLLEASALTEVPIYVVLTMRSDFIGDCSQFERLAEAINAGEYLIPRLTWDQYKRVIEGPVRVGQAEVTPRLLQRLLNDVRQEQDQLPCLQHALMRTWDIWTATDRSTPLDLEHYERAGKTSSALSLHADEVYAALATDRQRAICETLFKALTVRESERRGIRRPQSLMRLCEIIGVEPAELAPVIEAFRRPGVTFLMPASDVKLQENTVIDISHESLMRVWGRLRDWVEEEAQSVGIFHRLAESAALHAGGKAGLYRDPELGVALAWRDDTQPSAAWAEQYGGQFDEALEYLEQSRVTAQREAQQREADRQRELERAQRLAETQAKVARLFKRFAGSLAVGLCLAIALTIWAFKLRQEAKQQEVIANEQRVIALDKQQEAETQRAIAQHTAYIASMSSIPADWEKRNYRRVRETLASQKDFPEPSFEWFYWQRMTHLELSSFPTYAKGISAISLSPDGKRIALVMNDNTVEIRSLPAGEKLATFAGHTEMTMQAVFSPDGRLVASCGGQFFNGEIKLWNAETGEEIRSFEQVERRKRVVAFSPDGRFLASGGVDIETRLGLWEVATGRRLRTYSEGGSDKGWTGRVAFSNDGRSVLCLADGGVLRGYDVETGRLLDSVRSQGDFHPTDFALSPDSSRVAVHHGSITIYDFSSRDFSTPLLEIKEDIPGGLLHLAFSPDGSRLAATGEGDSALFDAVTGAHQLTLHGGSWEGEWLADSQRIISRDGDRRVKIWDATTNRERIHVATQYVPRAISRDGARLVVYLPQKGDGAHDDLRVQNRGGLGVLDAATGKLICQMREHEPNQVDGAAFSPDNKWIVSGDRVDGFIVWDAATGKVKQRVRTSKAERYNIGFGPTGDTVISRTEQPRGLAIWDLKTGREIMSPKTPIDEFPWAITRNGRRLAAGANDGTVRIWNTEGGNLLRKWKAHEKQEFAAFKVHYNECMDFSADGRRLVTAGEDGFVKMWDAETGTLERTFTGHAKIAYGVHFTPDQKRLISQSADLTVRIWDPETGRELLSLTDPAFEGMYLLYVGVSPDNRKVVAAPEDKTGLIIWEGATPAQVAAWRKEEEADAALWAAEEPKVEERKQARIAAADARRAAAEQEEQRQKERRLAAAAGLEGEAPQHRPSESESPLIPGDPGVLRQWLVLAPIPFDGNEDLNVLKQQIPDEARLRPRAGGHPATAPSDRTWTPVQLGPDSYQINFLALVKQADEAASTDHSAAYAVTYIVSDQPHSGLKMLVGSDDTARIYLNGKEVYRQLTPRSWEADQDEVAGIELKAGVNALVFKVANGLFDWAGSVRLLDADGNPVPGLSVTLEPD